MSDEPLKVGPIEYASGWMQIPVDLRPRVLLVPNLLAIVTLFLKLVPTESPLDALIQGIASRGHFWDLMIAAPFLLTIPLSMWTVRLCVSPWAGRVERIVALCVSGTSMSATVIVTGHCIFLAVVHQRFVVLAIFAVAAIAVLAGVLLRLRELFRTYMLALIAMTASSAINALLTVGIVLSHSHWRFGTVVDLLVSVLQLLATVVLVKKYRSAMAANGLV